MQKVKLGGSLKEVVAFLTHGPQHDKQAAFYEKGEKVLVIPTASGLMESYPAAKWLTKSTIVTLKEPATAGTLDVIDVDAPGQADASIYGFNIVRREYASKQAAKTTLPEKRGDESYTLLMSTLMLAIGWGPHDIPDYADMATDPTYHVFGEMEDPNYGEGHDITKQQAQALLGAKTMPELKTLVKQILGWTDEQFQSYEGEGGKE